VVDRFIRVRRVRAAMRLVGEVREIGATTEAGRQRLVDGLLGLVGCAIGGAVHDTGYAPGLKGGIAGATLGGFDRQILDVFQTHHTRGSDYNPFHREVMRRPAGKNDEVFTSTSAIIVATNDWDRSEWINEYVRPARVDHFVASLRKIGPQACSGCGFMRNAGDRPFTEEDALNPSRSAKAAAGTRAAAASDPA
jgi:hypothetical protein